MKFKEKMIIREAILKTLHVLQKSYDDQLDFRIEFEGSYFQEEFEGFENYLVWINTDCQTLCPADIPERYLGDNISEEELFVIRNGEKGLEFCWSLKIEIFDKRRVKNKKLDIP